MIRKQMSYTRKDLNCLRGTHFQMDMMWLFACDAALYTQTLL